MENWNGLKPIGNWVWRPIKKKKAPVEQNPLSKKQRQAIVKMVQRIFDVNMMLGI